MQSPWRYFSLDELKCKCGKCGSTGIEMDPFFMSLIVTAREKLAFPFPVNSAYRCPVHNNDTSKTGIYGPHTTGKAMDIGVQGTEADLLLDYLYVNLGFTGKGINQKGSGRFIHVDILTNAEGFPRPAIWSY